MITLGFLPHFLYSTLTVSSVRAVDGEVTYTSTNTNLSGDDIAAGPFNLGFTFNFYGSNFTQAYLNINGTLNFTENYSRYDNQPLATTKNSTNISDYSVYAFWDDLNTNASGGGSNKPIYYATIGNAPNRKFVAQWTNIYFHSTTVQMGTFQVILYEGSNDVQIQYRDLLGNATQLNRELGNNATIGLRKDNSYRNQYSHNSASLTQGQAIRYTPSGANTYNVNTSAPYDLIYLSPPGAPTSPTLVTPTDGSTGVTLSPTFEWLPVADAANYRVLISTASNFSTTIVDSTTTGTFYTHGSSLNTNTKYYWRIQATNNAGSSLSPTRSFTTASVENIAPNSPANVESNGLLGGASILSTTGKNISMVLSDTDENEQLRYRIQIASDINFNTLLIDYRSAFTDEGETSYTYGQSGGTYLVGNSATSLMDDEYYVRIRAEDDSAASSDWYTSGSVAFSIEQNASPQIPSQLGGASVIDGSVLSNNQPTLTFLLSDDNTSNTLKYELHIDDDADFSSPTIQYVSHLSAQGGRSFTVGQPSGSGTYNIGNVEQKLENKAYYWRVRAIDNHDSSSDYSIAGSGSVAFSINNNLPIISDLTATIVDTSTVDVSWDTDENTSSQVEYGLVSSYGLLTSVLNNSPKVASHNVSLSTLQPCARYFYRAKSVNNAGTSVVSEPKNFITPGCTLSVVKDGTENLVNVSGGIVEFVNNSTTAKLEIPPNFSDDSVQIQINLLDSTSPPPTPANTTLAAGNLYKLIAMKENSEPVTEFNTPVTLQFLYGSEIQNAFQLSTLDIYKYNIMTESWEKKNCIHDQESQSLTCTLSNFSVYGILGEPNPTPDSSDGTDKRSRQSDASRSCRSPSMISTPDLFQIDTSATQATVYFAPSSGGANQYIVSYGKNTDANDHAAILSPHDTSGAIPYTINGLTPGNWYFKIQGNNGCVYSDWSTTTSARIGQSALALAAASPWGSQKTIDTEAESTTPTTLSNTPSDAQLYTVRVKVATENKPLPKVKVRLQQTDQIVMTDEEGYATFEKVSEGFHRFRIVGEAFAHENAIEVRGDSTEFDVLINVNVNKSLISTQLHQLIGATLFIAFSFIFFVLKRSHKST